LMTESGDRRQEVGDRTVNEFVVFIELLCYQTQPTQVTQPPTKTPFLTEKNED
jgi:hypothetical protein